MLDALPLTILILGTAFASYCLGWSNCAAHYRKRQDDIRTLTMMLTEPVDHVEAEVVERI